MAAFIARAAPSPSSSGATMWAASAEAHLTWEGKALRFCSEGCLRRFLDRPEAYAQGDDS